MKSEKVTKTLKLKVVKPVNMDWKEFRTLINQKSYQATKFANKLMQKNYIERVGDDFEFDKTPDIYGEYKDKLSSYVRDAINQKVQTEMSGNKMKELLRGDSTLPTFKNKNSLFIRGEKRNNRNYSGFKFYQDDGDFYAELKIRPGRVSNRPKVLLATRNIEDNNPRYFKEISRVGRGEFRPALCQVLREHGDIFLSIPYERPIKDNKLDGSKIMGVDIGVKTIWATFNDDLARHKFYRRTDNIIRRKSEIRKQRKQIKENITLRDKRRGHGKNTKYKPLTDIKEKWNNFRRTSNHEMSRAVVDYAVKKKAGKIQVEDLTSGNKNKSNTFIGNDWPVGELLDQIENKSKEEGIETERINPRYTSRRCPSCGHINMYFSFDYRKKNNFPDFECRQCGMRQKADYVGARNIAEPDIENKINKRLKQQKQDKEQAEKELGEILI